MWKIIYEVFYKTHVIDCVVYGYTYEVKTENGFLGHYGSIVYGKQE